MRIAVVDDMAEDAKRLTAHIERFERERNVRFQTDVFHASFDFLEEYHNQYDVIFLDIEMPGSDGLEVAREIRRQDELAGIIFVTNMIQYAIRGYEVNAIDFMVKPVGYFNFACKLEIAMQFARRKSRQSLLLHDEQGLHRVAAAEILYIEKYKNYLIYHMSDRQFRERGTLQQAKEALGELPFSECTSGCLINLDYVECIGKETVLLEGRELPLSRRMRKQFTREYMDYMGGVGR